MQKTVCGLIADVVSGKIFPGEIVFGNGKILEVRERADAPADRMIVPGFVDAHVHVESSLLSPAAFGRAACIHGTAATVSDPHEIANVLGVAGVKWMLEDAKRSPIPIFFGAPSCVPATPFETAGAALGVSEIAHLLDLPEIKYLAEVMNFPAVINRDATMIAIIDAAKKRSKRIDGHAPAVVGAALKKYISAGIETDHECVTLDEARQRAALGMFVAIREGSAARNFDALVPLLRENPAMCFLCSDDKHPDDLLLGHINKLVARAVAAGVEPMDALRAATLNPVRHYGLEIGLLRAGDPADFAIINNLEKCDVIETWIRGEKVAAAGKCLLPELPPLPAEKCPNKFQKLPVTPADFAVQAPPEGRKIRVIVALDGQLLTDCAEEFPAVKNGNYISDTTRDLLKIVVVNRYDGAPPAVGFIKNFGLRSGALASSVAHDSHNIVAVGADDESLCAAVNKIIENKGGLSATFAGKTEILPLPIAGLMSAGSCAEVGAAFSRLTEAARAGGCRLRSPFMTLSFMALPVIPHLKITDKGLFNVDTFQPAALEV